VCVALGHTYTLLRCQPDLLWLRHIGGADRRADAELAGDGVCLCSQCVLGRQAMHHDVGACACKCSQDAKSKALRGACAVHVITAG